jgi:hypothetical protein
LRYFFFQAENEMELPFTHKPGRRERHLRRRHGNPLFAWPPIEVAPEDLLAAQKADHEEMEAFRETFRDLVQRALELPPSAGSDEVLELKGGLERAYEQACGLAEDHRQEKEAIRKLIALIMKAIWRQAGEDPLARQELAGEEAARAIHFRLLEQPLVADILHPESPIVPDELAPAVLSATPAEVEAVTEIFDAAQIGVLQEKGRRLVEQLASRDIDASAAAARLDQLQPLPAAQQPAPAVH